MFLFQLENEGLKLVRENAFLLLKAMAHEHPVIQCRLYDRMFELLNVMGADRQLAMVLTEVSLRTRSLIGTLNIFFIFKWVF